MALSPLKLSAKSHFKRNNVSVKPKNYPLKKQGSTNMALFGRVHECKECEHWSEKKVLVTSGMK